GTLATEDMPQASSHASPRVSEIAADAALAHGVNISIMRLSPSVHGEGDHHGFVPILINIARTKGKVAYIGDGQNRWNAVHRLDAALLYKLALENASPGTRLHAVAEEAVTFKDIAALIGKQL